MTANFKILGAPIMLNPDDCDGYEVLGEFSWEIPDELQEKLAIDFLADDYKITDEEQKEQLKKMVDDFDWWDDLLEYYEDSIIDDVEDNYYDEAYEDRYGRQ